ncbi:MAG: PEGA domain-containing protein [Ignavibacteriales bacterium]|nr:PEGA domain-containing protein [Ignavibacteriales bacterium]
MKKSLSLFFLSLLFFPAFLIAQPSRGFVNKGSTATDEITPGQYFALIIGVDKYADPAINSLEQPVKDAIRLERMIKSNYNFREENISFLENPTREDLLAVFERLSTQLGPEDNLLIFYAGHGYWDQDNGQGYWLPADARKSNRSRWVSNADLRDFVRGLKTKHTLLISDACFSGGIFRTRSAFDDASAAISELYRNPSRKAMTSGAMKEVPDKSVFIDYLVRKLEENNDPFLPSQRLFASLLEPVINNSTVKQTPQFGTIMETGDEGGDFIFYKPSAIKNANTLVIASNVEDAEVFLNGKYLGKANPLWKEPKITAGKNILEVKKEGYVSLKKEIDMPTRGEYAVNVELEAHHFADLSIEINQTNAAIYIDGTMIGTTNKNSQRISSRDLPWGDHTIEVEASGFKNYQQKITLKEHKEYPLFVNLKQSSATLALRGKVPSRVFLNNAFVGNAPAAALDVPAGLHDLKLSQPGYEDFEQEISVVADKQYTINYNLVQKTASSSFTRSLVFPGRGQFYQGRALAGWFYMTVFVGVAGAVAYCQNDLNEKTLAYNNAYDAYNKADQSSWHARKSELDLADSRLTTATDLRNYAAIGVIGVYLLNVVDVVLFAPEWKSPTLLEISYQPAHRGMVNCTASINF